MADSLSLHWRGEELRLLADRAVYWPRHRRLLVADLHLGKGDVFRRAGIPVPRGGTSADLARIDALLAQTQASELYVLGDLLHGPVPEAAWKQRWREWRDANASLRVAVLAGNHDRRLRAGELHIELLAECIEEAPFRLSHLPPAPKDAQATVCGHVHPVVRVEGTRLPCFWRQGETLVLPAFSAFTGGQAVTPRDGWLGVCVPGAIVPMGPAPR